MHYRDQQLPLLTIAIPTYNREKYLDLCLSQLCGQLEPFKNIIEFIISDNCSPDNTTQIVNQYIQQGHNINYIRNTENIGADRNMEQCFRLANGKYFWLFCDDDLLLDDRLKDIMAILQKNEYGNIFISNYWYSNDYEAEMPPIETMVDYTDYAKIEDYIERVNFWITFGTGNIINKSLLDSEFDSKKYIATNLNHLHWTLKSLYRAKANVVINTKLIACKSGNSGGYAHFGTFGTNMDYILTDLIREKIITLDTKTKIMKKLCCFFYPSLIMILRKNKAHKFEKDNPLVVLKPIYNNNFLYNAYILPIYYLPLFSAKVYYVLGVKILNLLKY